MPPVATFDQKLEPGHTYTVIVKTFSGKVASWPTTANVTTRPLPVENYKSHPRDDGGDILITWLPNPASKQDHYRVSANKLLLYYIYLFMEHQVK